VERSELENVSGTDATGIVSRTNIAPAPAQ
jgi:hypothetical protein